MKTRFLAAFLLALSTFGSLSAQNAVQINGKEVRYLGEMSAVQASRDCHALGAGEWHLPVEKNAHGKLTVYLPGDDLGQLVRQTFSQDIRVMDLEYINTEGFLKFPTKAIRGRAVAGGYVGAITIEKNFDLYAAIVLPVGNRSRVVPVLGDEVLSVLCVRSIP